MDSHFLPGTDSGKSTWGGVSLIVNSKWCSHLEIIYSGCSLHLKHVFNGKFAVCVCLWLYPDTHLLLIAFFDKNMRKYAFDIFSHVIKIHSSSLLWGRTILCFLCWNIVWHWCFPFPPVVRSQASVHFTAYFQKCVVEVLRLVSEYIMSGSTDRLLTQKEAHYERAMHTAIKGHFEHSNW